MYADTDFFLALLKQDDWLAENAKNIYKKHKDELWTSPITLQELILIAYRENKDPTDFIEKAYQLMEVRTPELGIEGHLGVCYLITKYDMSPFDAYHAVCCGKDTIVSSDKIYDKIGLRREKLEKRFEGSKPLR